MALLRQAYSALFRRTSTFALTVVLGAVLFERAFDQGADAIFEHLNEGVRKDRGAAGAVGGGSGPEGQRGAGGPGGCAALRGGVTSRRVRPDAGRRSGLGRVTSAPGRPKRAVPCPLPALRPGSGGRKEAGSSEHAE